MTLLVAVLCEGGVVLGADSGATFAALGQRTVMLAGTKIDTLSGRGLVAVSGPVGLHQRFVGEVSKALDSGSLVPPSADAMVSIAQLLRPHIAMEATAAEKLLPFVGHEVASASVLTSTAVAICLDGKAHLFSFDEKGAPEEATPDLPFVTLGGGQHLGDPFMAFFSKLFWSPGLLPSMGQATLATLWTLTQAIEVSPGGIMLPARIWVLETKGGCVSRELDPAADLGEHYEQIEGLKATLRDYQLPAKGKTAPAPPEPPSS